MKNLLNWYNKIPNKTIEDIIEFHVRFEKIHPFQDVNGSLVKNATYPHNAYKLGFSN
jgi:fido (protein-threonine AMPylation protein)